MTMNCSQHFSLFLQGRTLTVEQVQELLISCQKYHNNEKSIVLEASGKGNMLDHFHCCVLVQTRTRSIPADIPNPKSAATEPEEEPPTRVCYKST